jgi:hypothetical protein
MFNRGSLITSCITFTIPQSIWSEADMRTFIAKFPYIIVVMVVLVLAPYDRSMIVAPSFWSCLGISFVTTRSYFTESPVSASLKNSGNKNLTESASNCEVCDEIRSGF